MATYIQTQKYFTSQCLVTSATKWGTNLPFLLPWMYRHLHGPKQELYLTTKATRKYSYLDLPGRLAFYHGINPRDVVRGQNSLICKFFSSYQEQQLIRNHLFLDH